MNYKFLKPEPTFKSSCLGIFKFFQDGICHRNILVGEGDHKKHSNYDSRPVTVTVIRITTFMSVYFFKFGFLKICFRSVV